MDLVERVVKSAMKNYGLNFEMNEQEMLNSVSRVIYNHYMNSKIPMFEAKKSTELVMKNEVFVDNILTEIKYHKQGLK